MSADTLPLAAQTDALDQADPLASRRNLFDLPEGITYLVGHSLGPASHAALLRLQEVASREWADGLVRSWNTAGWIDLPDRIGNRLARLLGAPAGTVNACDSVSVNLFKLAASALPHARTNMIAIESDEFPTDQYVAEGLARVQGAAFHRISPGTAEDALRQGGVLIKSLVSYRTSEIADMSALETVARSHGARIVWDLSHATGVVDIGLATNGARLAAGCTYKYLNGGPGAPAFVYAEPELGDTLQTPIPGWLGHAAPFDFSPHYTPADGIARFVAGTPPILSMAALESALEAFDGIEVAQLEQKAQGLGDLCLQEAERLGLEAQCPGPGERRGGHVSLKHEQGYAIVQALADQGILADFRVPDTIRFGFSPLILSYSDVAHAMRVLDTILAERLWDQPQYKDRAKVT